MDKKNDFKQGLKFTSLFGGLQIFNIIISIIRSKTIAVLLGPLGMGIAGMLNSTLAIIGAITDMGLGTSAVRDVSEAFVSKNFYKFNRVISIFRKLVWITGFLGLVFCLLLSPFLSKITFGNYNYTISFVILSFTMLINQVSTGQRVVLQGTRKFKSMATSSLYGSVIGFIIGLPLYYFFRYDGIVPCILISSFISLFFTYYYSRKIPTKKISVSFLDVFKEGKIMLKLGFFIALQGFMSILCAYLIRLYISNKGTLEDVGLYNSGFAIINSYVGLVFTAMSTEYYPRLSGYADNILNFNNAINQQMKLSLLLIAPIVAFFLIFGELAIQILYSSKFLGAYMMITLGALGLFFKAPGWCLDFSFLAKGDYKYFWITEFISEVYFLIINIVFYHYWGLTGIGFSFLLNYIIYWLQCMIICSKKYKYHINRDILVMLFAQFTLCVCIMLVAMYSSSIYKYTLGTCLFLLSSYLSYKKINEQINIKSILYKRLTKK